MQIEEYKQERKERSMRRDCKENYRHITFRVYNECATVTNVNSLALRAMWSLRVVYIQMFKGLV